MSVHDVAAVDRVSSLRRTPAPQTRPSSGSSLRVSSSITSLPTSPSRGHRPDSDTLRRAMARHQVTSTQNIFSNIVKNIFQASLSRPESPKTQNDDLPIQSRNVTMRGSSGAGDFYPSPVVTRHRERSGTGFSSIISIICYLETIVIGWSPQQDTEQQLQLETIEPPEQLQVIWFLS